MSTQATDREKRKVKESFQDANKLDLRNEIQEQYGSQSKSWFSWLFDLLELPAKSRILELGGGSGAVWDENLARMPAGWKVYLTDQSINMLVSARSNLANSGRHFRNLAVDGQVLPFHDQSFDAVIAVGLLDLLPDLDAALDEIRRVLKPRGLFLATAGGKGHLKEMETLVSPYLPGEKAKDIGGDERRFGLENGKDLLADRFANITRHDYYDQMEFRSLQPVLTYVLSENAVVSAMTLDQLASFVQRLKTSLNKHGSINVSVRKGAFLACKKAG